MPDISVNIVKRPPRAFIEDDQEFLARGEHLLPHYFNEPDGPTGVTFPPGQASKRAARRVIILYRK